jgi:GxxExxY protein
MKNKLLTEKIIKCALEVHNHLGPGLLEKTYGDCLAYEFSNIGLYFERQKSISVKYKGLIIDDSYRLDFLIENQIILEIKSVKQIVSVHLAQVIAYLNAANIETGLLINFNNFYLKDGIKRIFAKPKKKPLYKTSLDCSSL